MRERQSCARVECGSIYSADGRIVERPALVVDEASDALLSWGEAAAVETKYLTLTRRLAEAGLDAGAVVMITMDDLALSREEQCYVVRRRVEYSASGFQSALCRELRSGRDPRPWLRAEMARVPIDVTR